MLSIYNKIRDYIIVLNYKGEIIFCNESFLNRLNYKQGEIFNTSISNIITNEDKKSVERLEDENKTLEFYSKSNELVRINTNISIENFNNEKSIFIIGKEVYQKTYTMEMLEALLDNINVCTFIADAYGKYLYVNKPFTNILNKKREDIIGTYNSDYWEENIYKVFDENNKEVFKNKSPKIFHEEILSGENSYWYESYKSPIFDENEKPKYIVSTTKNYSLSKIVSEELYKNYNIATLERDSNGSCNDLKNILTNIGENIINYTNADGLSIMLYDIDKEGLVPFIKLKDANKYLENVEFTQVKLNELKSDKYRVYINRILPRKKFDNILNPDYKCVDELDYSGNYIIKLDEEIIGFITLSYRNGNGPKFNSDEYMKYISNRIAMIIKNVRLKYEVSVENKMREYTEKELERYLDISVDLVAIAGRDGYLKRVSSSWYDVLGWTEEELLSMPCTDIIHPEDLASFKGKKILDDIEGIVITNIIRFRHKNGQYIYLEWNSKYIGEQEAYITSAKDITRRLEIEKEKITLEEAVKSEIVKNEFFSNISHEFRTPINIILGTMQVINKNIENNNIKLDSLKKYTNYIKQNSYRLLRLVNNLIDINKMDIGMYELRCSNNNIVNIIEDITTSVAEYTKDNNINLVFDTDNEEVITCCDPDKIERIMLNLLSNAIKYTQENGFISVNINSTVDEVVVSVKDSGIGIPIDKLDMIFDRFGQVDESLNRKCEGSGIGLSLVKNLVELHGGKVSVKSKVNEGSEFIFSLPINLNEESNNKYDIDRKSKHVERCDIEFSDIYNL